MVIVSLTDIHGDVSGLRRLADPLAAADVVLLTGDLTHFGHAEDARRIVEAVRAANPRVFAVPGNCDHPDVLAWLEAEDLSLHGRARTVDGIAFAGVGGSLPCPGRTPLEFSEGELADLLDTAAGSAPEGAPLVLACHQPPFGTVLDRARGGAHVGSPGIRDCIARARPVLFFSGHIHEAAGVDALGATRLANPGPLRAGHCAYAAVGDDVEVLELRAR